MVEVRSSAELLERCPGEEEALLAHLGEVDDRLGLVAPALDADDHAFAELLVTHVVADAQTELVGAAGRRRTRTERRLDGSVAVRIDVRRAPRAGLAP